MESFLLSQPPGGLPLTTAVSTPLIGALLFVDISGFTALSERLSLQGARGLEELSSHLNGYFSVMLDCIHRHGGDVVKFAGDALMVLFAAEGEEAPLTATEESTETATEGSTEASHPSSPSPLSSSVLQLLTYRACLCVLSLHGQLDFYAPIPSFTLRLHSAVVAGKLFGLHLGGWKGRWEWLVEGPPLALLREAMDVSEKGQVVIHSSAYEVVRAFVTVEAIKERREEGGVEGRGEVSPCHLLLGVLPLSTTSTAAPFSSARKGNSRKPHLTIQVPSPATLSVLLHSSPSTSLSSLPSFPSTSVSSRHLPFVPSDAPTHSLSTRAECDLAMCGYVPSAILTRVAAGHASWLAEFRRVTTLFINLPPVHLSGPGGGAELERFQARVLLLMSVCQHHRGDVRQLLTDDKGTVCILLFGLQASWANPLLGVQAARCIRSRMRQQALGRVAIGVTTGQVFCGTVGNASRCEYTVMGDKVNTSARLMAAVQRKDGILCDQDTVDAVGQNNPHIQFLPLPPIRLKGKAELVPVFRPVQRQRGEQLRGVSSGGSGKESSTTVLVRVVQQSRVRQFLLLSSSSPASSIPPASPPPNRLYIEAASRGMGKSLFLQWTTSICEREGHLLVLQSRASELDQTPYYALQSIVPQLFHTLFRLRLAATEGRGGESSQDPSLPPSDLLESDGVSGAADWLWDPSSLSLPAPLRSDPTPLLLFNSLCPAVHFQPSQSLSIQLQPPIAPALSPSKKVLSTSAHLSASPPSAASAASPATPAVSASVRPHSKESPPLVPGPSTSSTVSPAPPPVPPVAPKQAIPPGSILSLLSSLTSHCQSLLNVGTLADEGQGLAVVIDDAQFLDSASEELLLGLSKQLPQVRFIFAGLRIAEDIGEEGDSSVPPSSLTMSRQAQHKTTAGRLRQRLTFVEPPPLPTAKDEGEGHLGDVPPPQPPLSTAVAGSPMPTTSSNPSTTITTTSTTTPSAVNPISTASPNAQPQWLTLAAVASFPTFLITLDCLNESELLQLIKAELQCTAVDSAVTSFLLERSTGNPLFACEILRSLLKGAMLSLTTESDMAVDSKGGVRRHLVSTQHIQQVKLSQHSESGAGGGGAVPPLLPSSPPISAPFSSSSSPLNPHPLHVHSSPDADSSASVEQSHSVHSSHQLVCSFSSAFTSDDGVDVFSLPVSMDEMLASRFDGLSPDLQLFLRMAAVFGREVDLDCIATLWKDLGRRRGKGMNGDVGQMGMLRSASAPDEDSPYSDTLSSHNSPHASVASLSPVGSISSPLSGHSVVQSSHRFSQLCVALLHTGLLVQSGGGSASGVGSSSAAPASSSLYYWAQVSMLDVIYHRMPFSLRCRLHLSITAWYEGHFSLAQLPPLYSRLAHHFYQAAVAPYQQEEDGNSVGESSPAPSSSTASPFPSHSPNVPVGGDISPAVATSTASSHFSPSLDSRRSPPSSASSFASTSAPPSSLYAVKCSAIRYLRLQGQQAIHQHAKREAVQALMKALHLIDQLPDSQSLHWKSERLSVMAQYAPSYANLVGTPLGVEVYAQLYQLCEEVQRMTEETREREQSLAINPTDSAKTSHPTLEGEKDGHAATAAAGAAGATASAADAGRDLSLSQTVKETFYALRGYYFSLISCNLFQEAWRLTPRLVAIAEASGDVLQLQHAWLTLSIQYCQTGDDECSMDWTNRIIALDKRQQLIDPIPYTVNPLAPMDPVVWALGHTINIAAIRGDFAVLERTFQEIFPLVEKNAEPVAYQQSIFHHCWASWTAELPGTEIDRYWAHVKSSNYQMVSLLLEVLFALLQSDSTSPDTFKANAERIWAKFCAGASFFLVLGAPLCQLLLSAGMWREGLTLVDRWKVISDDGTKLLFNYSDCLRFRALYTLQRAYHSCGGGQEDNETPSSTGGDSPIGLVELSLTLLQRSVEVARQLKVAGLEVKSLLCSIYISSALLHLPISSSEFPSSALLCPPHLPLDVFLSDLPIGPSPLISLPLLASAKQRVLALVGGMEERAVGTSLIGSSTLIARAKSATMTEWDGAKR